ncbi:PilT/PilU family type 4a pilus ATPase [Orbus sturtevantii]|uniref:type IV pilus twitching motility protein PilT n=1 Tax=Orbus sturtevantii TaxID=3074109 RepID=UPI00370D055D
METIFALSVTQNASDLHLSSGEKVIIRQNGKLINLTNDRLSSQELEKKLFAILTLEQLQQIEEHKQVDFAYHHQKLGRFRGNIFYQKRGISACFRVIRDEIYTLDEINAPEILKTLVMKKQGLIFITGATGCGKSTTLAAMLEYVNRHQCKHILTLEDPIEFIYTNKLALIQQREIGTHCNRFYDGLISMLRQDPDIIMLGELRDKETVAAALQAAETGHLVLATLHTNSAIQTLNRIIDLFPEQSKNFICSQLANSLQAVISQQLITNIKGERKAIFEVLVNTPAVSNLILQGKTKQLVSLMQTGSQHGMSLMDGE